MTRQRPSLVSGTFALAAGVYWVAYALMQFAFIRPEFETDPAVMGIVGGLAVLAVLCNIAAGIEAFRGRPSWCALLVKTHLLVLILIAIAFCAFSDSTMLSALAAAWCGGWFGIGLVPISLTPFLLLGQWIYAERAEGRSLTSQMRGAAIGALLMLGALSIGVSAAASRSHDAFVFLALTAGLHFLTAIALIWSWKIGSWMAWILGALFLFLGLFLPHATISDPASMLAGVQFILQLEWQNLAPWIPFFGYALLTVCGVWLCFFAPNSAASKPSPFWNRR